jgi:alpha-D-xyloside xylohydrolase
LPMMRALFVEYPNDPGAWLIDDQYLFGSDLLIAPMFEEVASRDVYLPGNHKWIDYQTGNVYNPGWNHIKAGNVSAVILARDGAVIPHIGLAQSTGNMDWSNIELKVYADSATRGAGIICLPEDSVLRNVQVVKRGGRFALESNPLAGRSKISVTTASSRR